MLADRILFIDAEAMLLDKPAGLPVDAPRDRSPSVESALESLRFGFLRRPAPVHRLDRDTSGVLLLSRNPRAHKRLARTFEEGDAQKTYLAVLEGRPDRDLGRIMMAIGKRSTADDGWRMVPDRKGKPATTDWRVLGEAHGRTLIEFRPQTGRTHQLRVHAAEALGCPIVGDPVYGSGNGREPMLLHALRLVLPRALKPAIDGSAPLPESFAPWAAFAPAPADYIPSDHVRV
jgi:tRNA pseudouridine32 synthase / 23S rRNA pseudouridine746 synthase